ncbi:hypothetical protein OSL66_24090, partial [Escherichia coli]|nr:hypothetical protein [Escherichia coli]MDA6909174.1 hypothetical protein [Escherichia coli]
QGRDYQESAGQSDPLRLLCQTVTHRIPAKWYLNQSQSGFCQSVIESSGILSPDKYESPSEDTGR